MHNIDAEPPRYDRKLPEGWEVGDLLPGPLTYMKLPIAKFTHATARLGELEHQATPHDAYSSRPLHRDLTVERSRREVQHQPGKGWPKKTCGRSEFHPKTLDYRTVDELGLLVEQLDEQNYPRTVLAKQAAEQYVDNMVVEGAELLREAEGNAQVESIALEPGKPVMGEIKPMHKKESHYGFYKVLVPQRDVPVGLLVVLKRTGGIGDPDIFVCNRNSLPMVQPHEHTWKSQNAGDDEIFIPVHDPLYLPGPFYIGVHSLKECGYELRADLIEHRVHVKAPMAAEGNGYAEVKRNLLLADTRRRFCQQGAGFLEQLASPRSLQPSAPPSAAPPSPRFARPQTASSTGSQDGTSSSAAPERPSSLRPAGSPRRPPHSARARLYEGGAAPMAPPDEEPRAVTARGSSRFPLAPPAAAPAAEDFSIASLPFGTRQQLLQQTVKSSTPRGRPDTLWATHTRGERVVNRPGTPHAASNGMGGGESDEAEHEESADEEGGGKNHTPAPPSTPSALIAARSPPDCRLIAPPTLCITGNGRPGTPSASGSGAKDLMRASVHSASGAKPSSRPGSAPGAGSRSRASGHASMFAELDQRQEKQPRAREELYPALPSAVARAQRAAAAGDGEAVVLRSPRQSAAGAQAADMLHALEVARVKPKHSAEEEAALTELERLIRADGGGDVLVTVRDYLAAQHNVSTEVIASREQIPIGDRVDLEKSEWLGLQNLLTHRLRNTLDAQAAARRNAYRFRSKASQHLDIESATNWNPERALGLLTRESLKMKTSYDETLARYVEQMAQEQEDERVNQERTAARLRVRATMMSAQASVRMLRHARQSLDTKRGALGHSRRESALGVKRESMRAPGPPKRKSALGSSVGSGAPKGRVSLGM